MVSDFVRNISELIEYLKTPSRLTPMLHILQSEQKILFSIQLITILMKIIDRNVSEEILDDDFNMMTYTCSNCGDRRILGGKDIFKQLKVNISASIKCSQCDNMISFISILEQQKLD